MHNSHTMNLYLRYFDNETLVHTVDEAIDFLSSIPEIGMNAELEADIREYAASDVCYPKRYKVRSRIYFIVIKTLAACMQDFKEKKALRPAAKKDGSETAAEGNNKENDMFDRRAQIASQLMQRREGWYEGVVDFKRVVLLPTTGKHEYRDTRFVARVKAVSGQDCYNRIIGHLKERVDSRSQFPSVKGKNFQFRYLGLWK